MHSSKNVVYQGADLDIAKRVMIMLHGRGATAESILALHAYFDYQDMAYVAPQATQNTWYPYSFMAPTLENEPGLSSGLQVIDELVRTLINQHNFEAENIYLLGFSQGACLALEYAARNAKNYGGVFALSGGLIGASIANENYSGRFESTPILIGCSDSDFHIPKERVIESGPILEAMGAAVSVQLYPNFGHNVHENEIKFVNGILDKQKK